MQLLLAAVLSQKPGWLSIRLSICICMYMWLVFVFSFGKSWTNIGYSDWDLRLCSSGENLFLPSDAYVQINQKLHF